jgi:hypothetical protein
MSQISIYTSILIILCCSCYSQKQINSPASAKIDSTLIKPYLLISRNASKKENEFCQDVIHTITKFQNKILDTTVLVIGKVDSDELIDTIQSHIFVRHDTVLVQSIWKRKGKLIWSSESKNPYLWISDNPIFDYSSRSIWVTFTIGHKYAVPRLIEKSTFNELEVATDTGMKEFEKLGYKIEKTSYVQYITNFKGSIIEFDDPEVHPCYIWYEPLKRFILFWVG